MKIFAALVAIGLTAGPAWAYDSVSCNIDIRVDAQITALDLNQEVGSERIKCAADRSGALAEVRVVRMVKTIAAARADAQAQGKANANSHYSDSCYASCSQGSGSCSTSGSGWGSCSNSRSDSANSSKTAETEFAVARAALSSLSAKGFGARVVGPDGSCELTDMRGNALDVLKAIAVVTAIYGQQLMSDSGAAVAPANNQVLAAPMAPAGVSPQ